VKILVDESLPRAVTRALRAAGHDVEDARDVGLRGKDDGVVQVRAARQGAVLVSGDLDFANAVRFPAGSHPGVVVLRVPDSWFPADRAQRLVEALTELGPETIAGAIVIVEPAHCRVFRARG